MDGKSLRQTLFSTHDQQSQLGRYPVLPIDAQHANLDLSLSNARYMQHPTARLRDDSRQGGQPGRPSWIRNSIGSDPPHIPPGSGPIHPQVGSDPDATESQQAADYTNSKPQVSVYTANTLLRVSEARNSAQQIGMVIARDLPVSRKSRAFSQTRPGRSLHQRLELDDDVQEPPPYPSVPPSTCAVDIQPAKLLPKPDDVVPPVYSRSASVLSSAHGRQDDDISSILMRGATDIRNAKFEIEEQRREIAFLHSQIEASKKEKDELSQRLRAVKEAAKHSLQASSKSLEGFRSTLNELKAQSDTAFGTLTDARSSLANVQELRTIVSSSIQDIQPYVDGGEESLKWKATKDTLLSLQSECFQSQQVADLLRDRLQSLGGELIDAKNRVIELETAQAEDRATICRGNAAIARTAEELSALVACASKQRGELYDALSAAADYEAKLNSASSRINDMQDLLQRKEEEMQVLTGVQQDMVKLQGRIAEQNVYIAKLEGVKNEVAVMQTAIGDRDARIAELTVVNASHERESLKHREDLRGLADQLAEMTMSAQSLKEDLGASKAREQATILENQRVCDEKKTVVERVRDLEVILGRVRQDLDTRSERLREANSRCQALEERFEDQSVTLRITRESAGDTQERLLSAETSHAKELAEVDAKYKQEIAVLHEQKLGLQTTVSVLETALKGQEAAIKALQEDNAKRLTELNAAHAQRLEQEGKHLQRLTDDLTDSRARIVASETRAGRLDEDVRDLYRQLKEAQLPSPEMDAEMRSLRSEVTRLEGAEMQNILRTKTIESRYRTGDLNEEERAFINNLVRTSQAIHEQELVANRNELRRRDNALKEMRAKIHLLESTLSRHINPPKAKTAPPTIDSRSMIDPTAWMSSGQSSSPVQAPDRDGQTNVDDAVPAKLSPAANIPTGALPAAQTASAHTPMPAADLVRKTPPEAKAVGAVQAKKPNFSRLATDCSDEILDFDDEHAGHGPGSATSLGKRTKPSSPVNNDGGPVIPKPLKRLRTTVRKVAVTEEAHAVVSAKKAIQPSSSKNRARKRR